MKDLKLILGSFLTAGVNDLLLLSKTRLEAFCCLISPTEYLLGASPGGIERFWRKVKPFNIIFLVVGHKSDLVAE